MTAAYQSVESNSNNVGGTTVVNRPSGTVNGDLLLAFVANLNPGSTYTPAPGWTLKAGSTSSDAIYERIASSEPATSTWTPGALAGLKVTIVRINGQAASSPTAATSILALAAGTGGGGNQFAIPSLTSPGAGYLLLQVVNSGGNGTANFWTPPGTATERFDYLDAGLTYPAGGGDEVVGSGATGTRTWTAAASSNAAGYMVAIAPAASSQSATLGTASLTATAQDETRTPGGVSASLGTAALSAVAQNESSTPGGVSRDLTEAALNAVAQDLTATPGGVAATLGSASLGAVARDISRSAGQVANLGTAALIANAQGITAVPGGVVATFGTASLSANAQPFTSAEHLREVRPLFWNDDGDIEEINDHERVLSSLVADVFYEGTPASINFVDVGGGQHKLVVTIP